PGSSAPSPGAPLGPYARHLGPLAPRHLGPPAPSLGPLASCLPPRSRPLAPRPLVPSAPRPRHPRVWPLLLQLLLLLLLLLSTAPLWLRFNLTTCPVSLQPPPATADGATRSQWLSRDATARLAIRNHLPVAECTHFGQHTTAQALYDTVVARYSSPATAALGRLLLPYLFPELSAFATVADLVTHLRTSDARYRATVPADFLAMNQPPMFITLYFIVSRLPDSLRSVRDHFLSLDPTSLTVDC
ncbi:unnamed protein product, partial [Closterium sp. NIES-53]